MFGIPNKLFKKYLAIKINLFLMMLCCFIMNAQEASSYKITKFTQQSFLKIDFLSVDMFEDDNLGLGGLHYDFMLNDWSYVGVGMYGSVVGNKGGFFTLGVEAGIRKNISKRFYFDTGIHFGGGGGSGAPDGGGAFILPHFNLGYEFSGFSIEGGYSYINFIDKGNIEGHQLNLGVQIPLTFDYAEFNNLEREIKNDENINKSEWYQESKKFSMLFHFNNLKLIGDTQNRNEIPFTDTTIRTVGIELNSYIKDNAFIFLKADGAYHGIDAGYMDIILGLGYQYSFNKNRTSLLGKFGVGGAGGGFVDIQGGFVIYPDISLEHKLFKNTVISINKGMLLNPNGHFMSSTYGLGLKYYVNHNGLISPNGNNFSSAKFKGKEIIIGQEVYLDAANRILDPYNMYQIFLQFNFYINKNIYAAGQTAFANFGYAGAYAEGTVGIGLSTSTGFSKKVQLYSQILTGAAGGGFIDTGQGLIVKPSAGVTLFFNDKLGLRTSAGQVIALDGELNSTLFNLGISYRFATLKSN